MNMASNYAAFSVLDATINRTKSLLWPFNLGVWLRLAVISVSYTHLRAHET